MTERCAQRLASADWHEAAPRRDERPAWPGEFGRRLVLLAAELPGLIDQAAVPDEPAAGEILPALRRARAAAEGCLRRAFVLQRDIDRAVTGHSADDLTNRLERLTDAISLQLGLIRHRLAVAENRLAGR